MKRYLSLIMLLLAYIYAGAEDVSRQQARQIAESFFNNRGIEMLDNGDSGLKKSAIRKATDAPYYVFNAGNNNGYVVVSGNDVTEQILGYTDSGSFDEDNLPPSLKSLLQYYADEIRWVKDHPEKVKPASKAKRKIAQTRHSIAPILTCTWNQGDPYNYSCPDYYNEDGTTGRPASGCVATALTQVIYHYKYPSETTGRIPAHTNSYNTTDGTKTVRMPAIEAGTKIDWANMLDSYNGSETEEQKKAIGDLTLYVGQAVRMGYGASSGSSYHYAEEMFEKYLGFDDCCYRAFNTDYGIQDWFDLIYNELAAGYPVAYGGSSTGGGHAFVLDGFDGEGLFHVNWGWGGGSNGYFRITVLNPGDNSGIGASSSADGYTMGQDAIINLRPGDDGTIDKSNLNMTIASPRIQGTTIRASFRNGTSTANSYETAIVRKGDFGQWEVVGEMQTLTDLAKGTTKSLVFDVAGAFTTPGEYRLTPAARLQGETKWVPFWNLTGERIDATVDEELNVKLTKHNKVTSVEVTNWDFKGNLVVNNKQELIATIKNLGDEYKETVELYASQTNVKGSSRSRMMVRLKEGQSDEGAFYFEPNAVGTWNIWLCQGTRVLGSTTVEVTETATTKKANLYVNSITMQNGGYSNKLIGYATIKNNSRETFTGAIRLQLWIADIGNDGHAWSSQSTTVMLNDLKSGKTQNANFQFEGLEIGRRYYMAITYTTQDGDLGNGGIKWGKPWELKPGTLRWNTEGTISGTGTTSTLSFFTSHAGALFDGISPSAIKPGENTNILYAFINGATVSEGLEGLNVVNGNNAEEINLINKYAFYNPVNFTAKKTTFAYTFKTVSDGTKGWEAVTLPFKPESVTVDGVEVMWKTATNDGDFWLREFSYQDNYGNIVFADVESVESLRGATPYIIAATEKLAGKTVVFHGTDATFKITSEDKMVVSTDEFLFYGNTLKPRMQNVYMLNETGDAYEYVTTSTALEPFTNYFVTTLSEESRPQKIMIDKTATGISNIQTDNQNADNRIYDLQGRVVKNTGKGIYIKNGKKIIK